MIVTDSTTELNITLRSNSLIVDDAVISIKNETSGAETYTGTLTVSESSFYYTITDLAGFNFTNNENYILEVSFNNIVEYRATLYCINNLPKVYNTQKRINTNNEYITI